MCVFANIFFLYYGCCYISHGSLLIINREMSETAAEAAPTSWNEVGKSREKNIYNTTVTKRDELTMKRKVKVYL